METRESRLVQSQAAANLQGARFATTDKLKLFSVPVANAPGLKLADFTVATFTGYADVTLTAPWLTGLDGNARAFMKYDGVGAFSCTTAGTPETIYGWYIVDTGATAVLAYGFFDAPVVVENAGDKIVVDPFLYFDLLSDAEQEFIAGP
jgi:hypothetical protein